jgi:hypothetical protein
VKGRQRESTPRKLAQPFFLILLPRVPFDKSEGVVKGILFLCGAMSTAVLPEKAEDQGSGKFSLNHSAVELVPPTIDST